MRIGANVGGHCTVVLGVAGLRDRIGPDHDLVVHARDHEVVHVRLTGLRLVPRDPCRILDFLARQVAHHAGDLGPTASRTSGNEFM